jgi:hypothetical protein
VDEMDDSSPEVTISPADNGHVVRWHQRGSKKDEPGRTIKRVAMSSDDALGHAAEALGGGGKSRSPKKKSSRDGVRSPDPHQVASADAGEGSASPAAHSLRVRSRSVRRRQRVSGRRG